MALRHVTHNSLLSHYQVIKSDIRRACRLPCTNLILERQIRWDEGETEEKYCCFLSCHIPPPPTVSYGRRVMNILHCVFWHSRKIHLVSWQKCTSGTRRHPALAPQDRLLSSTASTSHAFLKSLVKDGHGYWKQKLWNFDLLAVSPRVRHVFVTFFHNRSFLLVGMQSTSSLTNSFSRLHSNHVLLKYLLLFCTKERK